MIVKTLTGRDPLDNLEEFLQQLNKHNLRLSSTKCTFGIEAGTFLGHMLTSKGIEANLDKCKAVNKMKSPSCIKEV